MLYGLGPGELLICLVPMFVIILAVVIGLVISNRRGRSDGDDSF